MTMGIRFGTVQSGHSGSPPSLSLDSSSFNYKQSDYRSGPPFVMGKYLGAIVHITPGTSSTFTAARITLTSGFQDGDELFGEGGHGASASSSGWNGTTKRVTLTASAANAAAWESELAYCGFVNTLVDACVTGDRVFTIEVQASDGSWSDPVEFTVTVDAVVDAPANPSTSDFLGSFAGSKWNGVGSDHYVAVSANVTCSDPISRYQYRSIDYNTNHSPIGNTDLGNGTIAGDPSLEYIAISQSLDDYTADGGVFLANFQARSYAWGQVSDWVSAGTAAQISWQAPSVSVDWNTGDVALTPNSVGTAYYYMGLTLESLVKQSGATFYGLSNGTYYAMVGLGDPADGHGVWYGNDTGGGGIGTDNRQPGLVLEAPVAVSDLSLSLDLATGITATWTAGLRSGNETLQISNGTWTNYNTTASSPLLVSDLSGIGAGNLNFRVKTFNHWGSATGNAANVTIGYPGNVTSLATTSAVTWNWDDDATSMTAHWHVEYRRKHLAGDDGWSDGGSVTTSDFALSSPSAGRYDLRVTGVNFLGNGTTSGVVESATSVPHDLTGLTSSMTQFPRIDLDWDNDSDDLADSWKIERAPAGSGTWTTLESAWTADSSYQDYPGGSGPWDYRVTPQNVSGNGASATTTIACGFISDVDGSLPIPSGTYKVEIWGKGGSMVSSDPYPGGAGGGAYASSTLTLSSGTYSWQVSSGTDSFFIDASTLLAKDGQNTGSDQTGGLGGDAAACVGTVKHSGGNGADGSFVVNGAGGAGAGRSADGAPGGQSGPFGTPIAPGGAAADGGGSGASTGGAWPDGVPGGGGAGTFTTGASGRIVISFP